METLSILLVQAQLDWKDPAANRSHLAGLLQAAEPGFNLAVLPETFTTGFLGDSDQTDEGMDGDTVAWMREQAATHGCALAGSAVIVDDGCRYNRMLFVRPDGEITFYDKRHLFAFGGEHERYTAGSRRVTARYLGWRINLQVCYDLRFPAWCRLRDDFDLQLYVANWPSKRVAHWSALLRARAIENQSYVVAVNRAGRDGKGIDYPGASVVLDPQGHALAELGEGEQSRLVTVRPGPVAETRRQFPFQADADRFRILD
jgi:predicted amidohydrolase